MDFLFLLMQGVKYFVKVSQFIELHFPSLPTHLKKFERLYELRNRLGCWDRKAPDEVCYDVFRSKIFKKALNVILKDLAYSSKDHSDLQTI